MLAILRLQFSTGLQQTANNCVVMMYNTGYYTGLGPRAFSVAGGRPIALELSTDSLRDPDFGRNSFIRLLKPHLFTLS